MLAEKTYLIKKTDADFYGCPHCGCCSRSVFYEVKGGSLSICDNCVTPFYIQENIINLLNYLNDSEKQTIIDATNNHPNKIKDCSGCIRRPLYQEEVSVFSTGMFETPGCFISGGDKGEHYSLVLKSTCFKAAKKVTSFFEAGAFSENDFVVIGAKRSYLPILYKLMLQIAKTERIDSHLVLRMQNLGR